MSKTTTKEHLTGMQNEINFLKQSRQIFDIPTSDFIHYIYDNAECRNFIVGKYTDKKPKIIYDSDQQKNGNDFRYKSVTIDLKVNSAKYNRAFFELSQDKYGKYTYNKDKDKHIIISVIARTNTIYAVPADFIVMLANKTIPLGMPLPDDFYNSRTFSFCQSKSTIEKNKQGLAINLDCLQEALRYYLAYCCYDGDMRYLLCKYSPFIDKDNTYIADEE